MRRLTYLTALALLAMLILVPSAGAQATRTVYIQDFYFSPAPIIVEPGTTVTWVNQGQAPHTVTHTGGAFDSGTLQPGESYSYTFNEAGTSYAYYCRIHPDMTGTIVVGGGGAAYFAGSASATASATASALAATGGLPVAPIAGAAAAGLIASGLAALRLVVRRDAS